jgi:hypothetical protein
MYVTIADLVPVERMRSHRSFSRCYAKLLLKRTDEIQIENPNKMAGLADQPFTPGSDVVENKCNPTFSFEVNGPDMAYRGMGDFHDPKYDLMENGVSFPSFSVACI